MHDRRGVRVALTAAQEGIWTGQEFDPDSPAFNTAEYVTIHGPVDIALFDQAVRTAVGETDVLSARFGEADDGQAWQDIGDCPDWTMKVVDVAAEPDPVAAALAWMHADLAVPVDLRRGPVFGQTLFLAGPELFLWYQRVHHIALDGFGLSLVARRVAEVYTALVDGTEPGPSGFGALADVVAEDLSYRDSPRFAADRDYWTGKADGKPVPVVLAQRSGVLAHSVVRESADLDGTDLAALKNAVGNATWSETLTAAFAAYLHRMTGAADLVFALPVMARIGSVSLRVPCMVTNVVPLWLRVESGMSLTDLTGQVAGELRAGRPHLRYRYEQLRRDLKLVASERKLFGPSVNIMPFDYGLRFAGHRGVVHNVSAGLVEDLVLHVYDRADGSGLRIVVDANPNCYTADEAATHLRRFLTFLRRVTAAPAAPIADADLLLDGERHRLLTEWNDTARVVPPVTVPDLFEERAATNPDRTALVADGGTFTFAELNRRANRLARLLVEEGAAPERYVALLLPRTADAIVALFAVLKSGAGYVPIDPDHPARRIALTLADSAPAVVLTTSATAAAAAAGAARVIVLDDPAIVARLDRLSDRDLTDGERHAPLIPANPACLIHTSGSTGTPKGVVIEHSGLANLFFHHRDTLIRPNAGPRVIKAALSASLSFDTSWEGLLWLLDGHELHFLGEDVRREPAAMLDYIHSRRVDFLDITPTYAEELLATGLLAEGRHRPAVIALGGEATGPALWSALRAAPDIATYNLYGPTECTVDTLHCALADSPDPIVGRPIANTRAYVLDSAHDLAPPGVVGELYFGGTPVARGYHERPDLTADRFTDDPFGLPGDRLYRTGDLARWRQDGTLEFLGRADDQVKVRGFRIEPGEIESVLSGHLQVARAAVVVRGGRLVAYVVPADTAPEPAALRQYAAERMPDYLVPPAYVVVDRLPRNTNGKLDRAALPAPDTAALTTGRPPRDRREVVLCGMFADLLGVESVGIDDDFFSLGGHSLLVGRLIGRIRTEFGVKLGIRAVFEAPTVAALAPRLTTEADESAYEPLLALRTSGSMPPLFCVAPATGLAWAYAGLLTRLPDRPLYGLQLIGADRHTGVAEMAADLVRHLRSVQRTGPYHLLGASFGGLVAHEMAAQLEEQGHRVEVLALLDAYPFPAAMRDRPAPTEAEFTAHVLDAAGFGVFDRLYRTYAHCAQAGAVWTPRHVETEVVLFVATEERTPDWPGPDSWQSHVDGLDVRPVAATHHGMTEAAALDVVGSVLADRTALRRAS